MESTRSTEAFRDDTASTSSTAVTTSESGQHHRRSITQICNWIKQEKKLIESSTHRKRIRLTGPGKKPSYKGEGVVNGSLEKVWECLKPVPKGLRVKWDNNVKKFEVLEQLKEESSRWWRARAQRLIALQFVR
ncbi:uncharacterized protein stard5 [Stigmatopora nigra]